MPSRNSYTEIASKRECKHSRYPTQDFHGFLLVFDLG
jgi:hypothetical protein